MRAWALAGLAQAWPVLRQATRDAALKARIDAWLLSAARAALPAWSPTLKAIRLPDNPPQNLLQWFAVAAAAVAKAVPQGPRAGELLSFGETVMRLSAAAVGPAGHDFLGPEVARGSRALLYTGFSLTALTALARLVERPGLDPWRLNDEALGRAARMAQQGFRQPALFERAARGHKQLVPDWSDQAWVARLPADLARDHAIDTRGVAGYHVFLGGSGKA